MKNFRIVGNILAGFNSWQNNCNKSCLQEEAARSVSVREGVHYPETVHSFLSQRLVHLVRLIVDTDADSFQSRLAPQGTGTSHSSSYYYPTVQNICCRWGSSSSDVDPKKK